MTVAVSYIPTLLFGLGAIADAFRVSPERVKRWIEQGAPVVVDGEGGSRRYTAELAALQAWRVQMSAAKDE